MSCPFCLGYAVDRVIFKGSPSIEKWEKHGKTNVSNGNSWVSTVFAGVLGHQNCLYNFKSCQKRWFSAKFWAALYLRCLLVQSHSSMNLSSWISNPQSWQQNVPISMNFPKLTLKVRSFRLILDSWFAGQRFLCRIPVNNRPKNEAFVLDAGCRFWWQFLSKTNITNLASFDSLSQNLPLERAWTRKLEWNNTKRKRHFAHLSGKKRFVALALKCWKGWHFRTWVCLVQS